MSETFSLVQGSREWHKLRKRAQTDLYWLASVVLGLEDKVPMTPRAHLALCLFASRQTGIPLIDNSRIQLIHVARGWGKTATITTARTIQRLLNNQNWAAGIMNERQDNANAFLAAIKGHFETNDFLRALFPELIPDFRKTTWAADRIVINRTSADPINPSVLAAGATATVTGVHVNEWIVDDLLSEDAAENARSGSFSEIEKLNRRIIQLQPMLKSPKKDPMTFIGTPWWPGDTYDHVKDIFSRGEELQQILWTIKLPDGEVQEVMLEQAGELAIFKFKPIQNGRAVFPERFDLKTLEQIREDDPVFYAAQYLLEPTAGGVAAFKSEYLRRFDWEVPASRGGGQIRYKNDEERSVFERTRDLRCVMSVDPAISKKQSSARTAITVIGSNGEKLFLLEAYADRLTPSAQAAKILEFYVIYQPQRIIIEDVAYQMALAEILTLMAKERGLTHLPIFTFKTGSEQKKTARIAGLEPYFRKGLFYWSPQTQPEFFDEYIHFTPELKNRKVDLLDAISFQKESWDHLQFLGTPAALATDEKRRGAEQGRAQKIREFYSRKRKTSEWRPNA